jgi:excisionase family DNA binding protein
MSDEKFIDVDEAAKLAGCGRRFIYTQVRLGKLRASRLDGRGTLRFRPEWICEWLDRAAPSVTSEDTKTELETDEQPDNRKNRPEAVRA